MINKFWATYYSFIFAFIILASAISSLIEYLHITDVKAIMGITLIFAGLMGIINQKIMSPLRKKKR